MSDIQPELWVELPAEAIAFYQAAFGAVVAHRVGDSEDIVAQLAVGNARFWIANPDAENGRFHPAALGGGTTRTLLVVNDPDAVVEAGSGAGATVTSPVSDEHSWRLGRITDPCGHRWEIGNRPGRGHPETKQDRPNVDPTIGVRSRRDEAPGANRTQRSRTLVVGRRGAPSALIEVGCVDAVFDDFEVRLLPECPAGRHCAARS